MLPTNTSRSVLIVDKDAARRGEIAAACVARGATVREADDPFSAMAALGQQRFDVLCAYAGPRHLSLRGLFQLAKRKRQDIEIHAFVLPEDRAAVEASFDGEASVTELSRGLVSIAEVLAGGAAAPLPSVDVAPPATAPLDAAPLDVPPLDVPPLEEPPFSETTAPVDAPPFAEGSSDEFSDDFRTPAPAGSWDADSGDESDLLDLRALGSTSGEGAPLVSGAEILIAAFARELTGTLVVHGDERRWVLSLYGGEPAWVEPPGGDAAVFERLVGRGLLSPAARPAPVPEGALLASLLAAGALSAEDAQAFMRQLLFDAALDLAALDSCLVEVREEPAFLRAPPPFRVNPFGLVLEARRRRLSPDELLAISLELEDAPLAASGKLDKVYGKVAPFLRGVDVRTVLEHGATLRAFREAAGVDAMLATQLVLALEAVGLVRIERATAGG